MKPVDLELHAVAKRVADRITATDEHSRYLNQAEQRMLARAYLDLLDASLERQSAEQPSPEVLLPSSHCSPAYLDHLPRLHAKPCGFGIDGGECYACELARKRGLP